MLLRRGPISRCAMQDVPISIRLHLRRVGITLVMVGVMDIAYMIYCIAHHLNYASSLNIFAVIAGIYLLRSNLRVANIIAWFAAFMVVGAIGGILFILPFCLPLGLLLTSIRENPIQDVLSIVIGTFLIAYLIWVYLQLRTSQILQAQVAAGVKERKPWTAALTATVLVVLMTVLMHGFLHGDAANRAIERAAQIDGQNFKYVVTSINISNGHVVAIVTAYNNSEIKTERVEFQE